MTVRQNIRSRPRTRSNQYNLSFRGSFECAATQHQHMMLIFSSRSRFRQTWECMRASRQYFVYVGMFLMSTNTRLPATQL